MYRVFEEWSDENYSRAGMTATVPASFQRVGLSVHVSQKLKVIRPCLYKRYYGKDETGHVSYPWDTALDYYSNMLAVKQQLSTAKEVTKAEQSAAFELYKEDDAVKGISAALRFNHIVSVENVRNNVNAERAVMHNSGFVEVLAHVLDNCKDTVFAELFRQHFTYLCSNTSQVKKDKTMSPQQVFFTIKCVAGFLTMVELVSNMVDWKIPSKVVQLQDKLLAAMYGAQGVSQKAKVTISDFAEIEQMMTTSFFYQIDRTPIQYVDEVVLKYKQLLEDKSRLQQNMKIIERNRQQGMKMSMEELTDETLGLLMEDFTFVNNMKNVQLNVLKHIRFKMPYLWGMDRGFPPSEKLSWCGMNQKIREAASATCRRLKALGIKPFQRHHKAIRQTDMMFTYVIDTNGKPLVPTEAQLEFNRKGIMTRDVLQEDIARMLERNNLLLHVQADKQSKAIAQDEDCEELKETFVGKKRKGGALNLESLLQNLEEQEQDFEKSVRAR